jgi:hypothetical protein
VEVGSTAKAGALIKPVKTSASVSLFMRVLLSKVNGVMPRERLDEWKKMASWCCIDTAGTGANA